MAHIVDPRSRVWAISARRKDNGNLLDYNVWADNGRLAKQYLIRNELAPRGIEVEFLSVSPVLNGNYERTINCKRNHPERYEQDSW